MLALTILALALILTNGVAGYVYFTLKGQKLEKSASEKRATLSDAEQEAIQKYRSQREKHMKATLLGIISMVILLIMNLGNK